MEKKLIVLLAVIILIITISFCLYSSDSTEESKLGGRTWKLSQYILNNELEYVDQNTSMICVFTDENALSGTLGNNYYFGTFKLNGNRFDITDFNSSNFISNENIMALENKYKELLLNTSYYSIENNSLIFFNQNYNKILIFIEEQLPIEQKKWHLYYSDPELPSLFLKNSTNLLFWKNGNITGNAGLIKYSAEYLLDNDKIRFNSLSIYNESDILLEINDESDLFFSLFRKIDSFHIMTDQLDFFDKSGKVILSYSDLPNELFLNDWYPVMCNINDQEISIPKNSYPIICFSPNGKVTGSLFNTTFIANYYVDEKSIKIDQIAIYRTTSEEYSNKYDDELNLFSLLEMTSSYSFSNNHIEIFNNNQTVILKCSNEPIIFK